MSMGRVIQTSGLVALALLVLLPVQGGGAPRMTPGIRSLPLRPRHVFLDNGSLQPGLPGAISTLPLFLRNGGNFGLGSGGFQQHQLTKPQSELMPPGMSGMGGKAGGLNGFSGGGY